MIRSVNEIEPQFQARINSTTRSLTMSKLLEEAFTKLAELPKADQDSIATWLLDEMVSDGDWKKLLSESGEYLERLADEAPAEHSASQTKELDPDEL